MSAPPMSATHVPPPPPVAGPRQPPLGDPVNARIVTLFPG